MCRRACVCVCACVRACECVCVRRRQCAFMCVCACARVSSPHGHAAPPVLLWLRHAARAALGPLLRMRSSSHRFSGGRWDGGRKRELSCLLVPTCCSSTQGPPGGYPHQAPPARKGAGSARFQAALDGLELDSKGPGLGPGWAILADHASTMNRVHDCCAFSTRAVDALNAGTRMAKNALNRV